jgi:hypothetical protein
MGKITKIDVRVGHEYATFFVEESEVVPRTTGGVQASATWTAYSSYGVFGHYWHSMGEPFGEFIKDIDADYLLGKIASKKLDDRKMIKSIKAAIIARRKARQITSDVAREALDALKTLEAEHSGDVLCHEIYMCSEICDTGIDLCDCETQEWDAQALHFVKKLWPAFVEKFNQQQTVSGAA